MLAAGEEPVAAAPLATTAVKALDLAAYVTEDNRRSLVFVAELCRTGCHPAQPVARQTAFFAVTKHLELAAPRIDAACTHVERDGIPLHNFGGAELRITLQGRSLARLVEVSLDGADVVFSDNYFDLPAGRAVSLSCPLPAGWDVARAAAALRVRSVYDSFQSHSL